MNKSKMIKKIDNIDEFNAIKTGYKTTTGLTTNNKDHHTMFFNKFKTQFNLKTKTNILWLSENHAFVYNYFKNNPTYKPTSKRSYYDTIANALLAIDKDKFKDDAKKYFQEARVIQEGVEKIRDDQALTESEKKNFICYETIVTKRDELIQQWKNDKGNKKLHMKMLILAINTYIPPLRLDFLTIELYEKKIPPPKNTTNYLWKHNNKYQLVINQDKVENKRKKQGLDREILDFHDNKFMNGSIMSELFDASFEILKRKYVLIAVTRQNESMTQSSYDSYLKGLFKKNVRQNILRKAFINHWHSDKQKLNLNEKKMLAQHMRHSYTIAQESYQKLEVEELCKDKVFKIKIKKNLKQPTIKELFKKMTIAESEPVQAVQAVQPVKEPFDVKLWNSNYQNLHRDRYRENSKKYYEENKDDKNRKKIIRYLKGGDGRVPSKKSIEKYDLKLVGGTWI